MSDNRSGRIDLTQVDQAIHIKDGDELRNINSFDYLKNVASHIPDSLRDIDSLTYLRDFFKSNKNYHHEYPYGDMYTRFLLMLESDIQQLDVQREQITRGINLKKAQLDTHTENLRGPEGKQYESLFKMTIRQLNEDIAKLEGKLAAIDKIVDSVYANPNKALERSAKMVGDIIEEGPSHTSSDIESHVRTRMQGKGSTTFEKFKDKVNYVTSYRDVNQTTPQQEGSNTGRLKAMVSSTFKPQSTTSLASIRTYEYQDGQGLPTEYRFGTQGQYHEKQARISPLFKSWLDVQQRKRESNPPSEDENKTRITHLYINNLGLDRTGYEGLREKLLTEQLHGLEHEHRNIAVITLPADKGLMDKHLLDNHERSVDIDVANLRMFNIATGRVAEPDTDPVKDFYISDNIKKMLYGESDGGYDRENEAEIINNLLHTSFEKLGFDERKKISPAEFQAVYFHFIKYELTDFIMKKLQPESFNMSCKDAIDRGGVSSAYYNLMKSLELGSPFSKEEFNRALHAAPTLVKGRGMNHHTRLIWNAVDAYLNSPQPKPDSPAWLTEWRNNNAPTSSRSGLISKLEGYMEKRDEDVRRYTSVFGKHDKETKIGAARKLLDLIKNPQNEDIKFTQKEWDALHQGKLSKVCEEIKKHGLLDLDTHKPAESKSTLKV